MCLSDSKSLRATKDSSEYSIWSQQCCGQDGLDFSSDFQSLQSLFKALEDRNKRTKHKWYPWHLHVTQLFQFSSKI